MRTQKTEGSLAQGDKDTCQRVSEEERPCVCTSEHISVLEDQLKLSKTMAEQMPESLPFPAAAVSIRFYLQKTCTH